MYVREDLGLSGRCGLPTKPIWSGYNVHVNLGAVRVVMEGATRGPTMILPRGQTSGSTCGRRPPQISNPSLTYDILWANRISQREGDKEKEKEPPDWEYGFHAIWVGVYL